ncbi:hypothetical protein [Halorientalis marina]|uniref:hypothetical protein n=1 Tax=Halorientalis marina TaxID=2931976 RepID=UPI001FF13BA3|nr:hypothetical protein [Halorientalis marina]
MSHQQHNTVPAEKVENSEKTVLFATAGNNIWHIPKETENGDFTTLCAINARILRATSLEKFNRRRNTSFCGSCAKMNGGNPYGDRDA